MSYLIITTTTDDKKIAETIANTLVEEQIAACVQIHTIQSTYTRENKPQHSDEYKLSIKTRKLLYDRVAITIKKLHNYDTPEIVGTPITYINEDYAGWIDENTKQ